jgi:hypothetical protein
VNRLLLEMLPDESLDTLVNLITPTGRTLAEVLLEDRVVDDTSRLLLDVELGDLLLGVWLLEDERFDDGVVDELLAGRLEVFDVDRDTPLLRKELVDVLLDLVSAIVTVILFITVTVLGGTIVIVVTAVRPDILVVVRRAVELMIFVEVWVMRSVVVLVVVDLEGAMDKHLQALDIAALFMLLNTAGVAHVEAVALLTSSVG